MRMQGVDQPIAFGDQGLCLTLPGKGRIRAMRCQGLHERAGQAKREVTAHHKAVVPTGCRHPGRPQPLSPLIQAGQGLQAQQLDRMAGAHPLCQGQRLASRGRAAEIQAQQRRVPGAQFERLMMEAVASNSSSRAIDTWPETAYGSSTGRSEYFSKMEGLTRSRFTWPIVQLEKRRSVISS